MTIGTGFFGRSSLTENLEPRDLMQWTQVAYAADPAEPFGDFGGLEPWTAAPAVEPAAPIPATAAAGAAPAADGISREELRRLVIEELREVVRG
jgi:hypothetical protein